MAVPHQASIIPQVSWFNGSAVPGLTVQRFNGLTGFNAVPTVNREP
jgi:hypothetical protein